MATPKKSEGAQDLAILQPSVRHFTEWTPARIRAAEQAADGGRLQQAALLCDELMADDRVKSSLDARSDALLSFPLAIDGDSDAMREALEQDWPLMVSQEALSQQVAWGVLLGFAPALLRMQRSPKSDRDLPIVEPWHPASFNFEWSKRTWDTATGDNSERVPVTFGEGQWWAYTPFGSHRPWSGGLWRGLALWWLLKRYARLDWARHSEQGATKVITTPDGSNKQHRDELAAALQSAGRNATIVLPPGYDAKIVETSANTEQIYRSQITMANEAIAIAIRGANLTSQVQSGSLAAAEVHERVEQKKSAFDAKRLSTSMQSQVIDHWSLHNFGAKPAPQISWDVEPQAEATQVAGTMDTVSKSLPGFAAAGFEVDHQKLIDRFGFDFLVPATSARKPTEPKRSVRAAASSPREAEAYIDRVAESAAQEGHGDILATVAAMLAAVQKAESYEDARALIEARYAAALPPNQLAEVTYAAILMAQLAGQTSAATEP